MNDPTTPAQIVQAHPMSTTEIILYAATAVGGMVGGVVTAVLRFGSRVTVLESGEAARTALAADVGRLRDEMAAHARDVSMVKGGTVDPAMLNASVQAAIATHMVAAVGPLQRQLDTLSAQHESTVRELTRVRDAAAHAEQEGARRWADQSSTLGGIAATLKALT